MPESPEIAVPRFPYAQTVSPVKEFIEAGCDFCFKNGRLSRLFCLYRSRMPIDINIVSVPTVQCLQKV